MTRLRLFPRYVHNFGNLRLGLTGPIPVPVIKWGAIVFGPLWLVYLWLGVGWGPVQMTVRFLLPGLLVWWVLRHATQGARVHEVAWSYARWGWRMVRSGPRVVVTEVRPRRVRSGARWLVVRP